MFITAREQLLDQTRTAFLLVLNPDRLSLLETAKTLDILTRFSIPVTALVINRVIPNEADGRFLEARRQQDTQYLDEIDHRFRYLPRVRVPLHPGDVHDIDLLRSVGRLIVDGIA